MSAPLPPDASRRDGPVAVIAVHGVSGFAPGASASRAADLLLAQGRSTAEAAGEEDAARYSGFGREAFRIATVPLRSSPSLAAGSGDAWAAQLHDHLEEHRPPPEDLAYETVRLRGQRMTRGDAAPATEVHVYEMHWSDFCRLGEGLIRLIGALYRLTFQMAWLGCQTLNDWPPGTRPLGLGLFGALHRAHAWALTRIVPVLNLAMLALIVTGATGLAEHPGFLELARLESPAPVYRILATVATILGVLGLAGGLLVRVRSLGAGPIPFGILVALAGMAGWNMWRLTHPLVGGERLPETICAATVWLLVSLVYARTIAVLEARHPRLRVEAFLAWLPLSAAFGAGLLVESSWPSALTAAAFAFTCGLALLSLVWGVVIALGTLVSLADTKLLLWFSLFRGKGPSAIRRAKARDRLGTALLSVAMPTLFVFYLNHSLWGVVFTPIQRGWFDVVASTPGSSPGVPGFLLATEQALRSVSNLPMFFHAWQADPTLLPSRFVTVMQDCVRMPVVEYVLAGVLLVACYSLWCVLPSVSAEGHSRRPEASTSPQAQDRERRRSQSLGRMLTAAYRHWLWIAQVVLLVGLILLFSGFLYQGLRVSRVLSAASWNGTGEARRVLLLADHATNVPSVLGHRRSALPSTTPEAAAPPWSRPPVLQSVVATAVLLLFLGLYPVTAGVVRPIFAALRSATGIGLEVTDYLRRHPRQATVRARILSRYAGLLRHVCEWRGPDGIGYSRIVILAHSQGTVITVDLLRLLRDEGFRAANGLTFAQDLEYGRLDIRLFTMGSPLRQLYAARFPDTFGWAGPPAEDGQAPETASGPDPARLLGLSVWCNAYRAADYVGRYLWQSGRPESRYFVPRLPGPAAAQNVLTAETEVPGPNSFRRIQVREYCLGSGAHTFYWSPDTPWVAQELDRLIGG